MKLNIRVVVCAAALAMGAVAVESSASAQAKWKCAYTGSWTKKGVHAGNFSWNVDWNKRPRDWKVIGNYRDRFGFSFLDGRCATGDKGRFCNLHQTYKSGKLQGRKYRWYGTYKDFKLPRDRAGRARTRNVFRGEWYLNGTYGGKWRATALCTKVR